MNNHVIPLQVPSRIHWRRFLGRMMRIAAPGLALMLGFLNTPVCATGWGEEFGVPGVADPVSELVRAVATAPDGSVYFGGEFTIAGRAKVSNIVRWDPSTNTFSALGSGLTTSSNIAGTGHVNAIAIDGTDVYVGGTFARAGGVTVNNIARWDGSQWHALAGGTNDEVWALAHDGTDLFVGGDFTSANGIAVNKVASWDGANFSALGTGLTGRPSGSFSDPTVRSFFIDGNDVYVGGHFVQAGGVNRYHIARWDGANWNSVGSGMNTTGSFFVQDVVANATHVYATGNFTTAGGVSVNRIARFSKAGGTWSALGSGLANTTNGTGLGMLLDSTTLHVGGKFPSAGGVTTYGYAQYDTGSGTWSGTGDGIPSGTSIWEFSLAGGKLFAGGDFSTIDAVGAAGVAALNGSWAPLLDGGIANGTEWANSSSLGPIAAGDDALFVALGFQNNQVGGVIADGGILEYDPVNQTWSTLPGSPDSVYRILVDGDLVYVGGEFFTVNGNPATGLAVWDRVSETWSDVGGSMNGAVFGLAKVGDELYVAGSFTEAGGAPATHLARWDGASWEAVGSGFVCSSLCFPGGPTDIEAIGTTLYIGGNFSSFDGVSASHIVALDTTTDTFSALGSGMNGIVEALDSDGTILYLGGRFTNAGGTGANRVASWNGSNFSALGSGITGGSFPIVNDLVAQGGQVFATGDFTTAGGVPIGTAGSGDIANWTGSAWQGMDNGLGGQPGTDIVLFGADVFVTGRFITAGGLYSTAGSKIALHMARFGLPSADLELTKTDSPDPVDVGDPLTYMLRVDNNGPETATGIVLVDTLPAGVTFDSAPGCTNDAGTVTCPVSDIVSGGFANVQINVTPGVAGTPVNSATVTANELDSVPGNNTDTEDTTVTASSDLSVTLSDNPDPVVVNQSLTYTITVDNDGPHDASAITVTGNLPADTVAGTLDSGCSVDTGVLTCDFGAISNGGNAAKNIEVTPEAIGDISFTVSVSSSSSDPNAANDSDTENTTVSAENAPEIDISPAGRDFGTTVVGTTVSQLFTVSNTGTGDLIVGQLGSSNPLAAPFSRTSDNCSNQTISPAGNCTFTIEFSPAGAGAAADSLNVPSNDADEADVTVNVSGEGAGGGAGDDTDGDGIPDTIDDDPNTASNACGGTHATLTGETADNGEVLQCAASNSVSVADDNTLEMGSRTEVYAPNATISNGFSLPVGAEFVIDNSNVLIP